MDNKNIRLLQSLLNQLDEKDKVIESLMTNISRDKELSTIRTKEKDKRHKNTVLVLELLLGVSLIANILFLINVI